ncbi:MAG: hypothetical protein ACRECA_07680 [Pseudolabrys sp.]
MLAMDFIAPPVGVGMSLAAWPAFHQDQTQVVNRAGKSDRLPVAVASKQQPRIVPSRHLLEGCEPVFSPLSAAAKLNYPGRCVA